MAMWFELLSEVMYFSTCTELDAYEVETMAVSTRKRKTSTVEFLLMPLAYFVFMNVYFENVPLSGIHSSLKMAKKKEKKKEKETSSNELLTNVSPTPARIKIMSHGGSTRTTLSLEGSDIYAKPRLEKEALVQTAVVSISEPVGVLLA